MKKQIFTFILLLFNLIAIAQDLNYIDSLKTVLQVEKIDINKVDILNEISWELSFSQPEECIKYAESAIEIAKNCNYNKGLGDAYKNKGNGFKNQGNNTDAIKNYQLAIEAYKLANDKIGVSRSMNNIGLVYIYESNYYDALNYLQQALNIAEESKDLRTISMCMNNIGLVMYSLKNYENALSYYKKSVKIKKELQDYKGISNCYNNIANIYADQELFDSALVNYQNSLTIVKELSDNQGTVMALLNIGQLLYDYEKYNEGLPYFTESIEISLKSNNKIGIITSYSGLALFYYKSQDYKKSVKYAEKALVIAKEINYLEELKNIYETLFLSYTEIKQYKTANEYCVLYKKLSDSLSEVNIQQNVLELEAIYQNEKKEKEIEIQNINIEKQKAEIKQHQTEKYFFITAILLLIVISVIIFKNFRDKKQANIILNQKNEEINQQNEEIKAQAENLRDLNDEITLQKDIIEKKNQNITASIVYAERIQNAVLPSEFFINNTLPDNFVVYIPRDIVSGDFYWIKQIGNLVIIAIADCTGHGVPGAFMSILSVALLNEIVRKQEITKPNHVLDELRKHIKDAFIQDDNSDRNEGLDIALCVFDKSNNIIDFSGAHNPLVLIRNKELVEFKADKQPVGAFPKEKPFTFQSISIQKNDLIYMFSDGYASQFGGQNNEKFKISKLKELLLNVCELEINEQKQQIINTFYEWKQDKTQTDDILIFGFKV